MEVLTSGKVSSGAVLFRKLNGYFSNNADTSSKAAAAWGTEEAFWDRTHDTENDSPSSGVHQKISRTLFMTELL